MQYPAEQEEQMQESVLRGGRVKGSLVVVAFSDRGSIMTFWWPVPSALYLIYLFIECGGGAGLLFYETRWRPCVALIRAIRCRRRSNWRVANCSGVVVRPKFNWFFPPGPGNPFHPSLSPWRMDGKTPAPIRHNSSLFNNRLVSVCCVAWPLST